MGIPEIWALSVETQGGAQQFPEVIEEMGILMINQKKYRHRAATVAPDHSQLD